MNFKDLVTFLIACLLSLGALAQYSLTGNFPLLEGQQVKLQGIDKSGRKYATIPVETGPPFRLKRGQFSG